MLVTQILIANCLIRLDAHFWIGRTDTPDVNGILVNDELGR